MTTAINPEKETAAPVLETKDLSKHFAVKSGGKKATLKAVDRANLKIYPGKTLGLVGESGSGKSTIGFTMVQLHKPTSGEILYEGIQMAGLKRRAIEIVEVPRGTLGRFRQRALAGSRVAAGSAWIRCSPRSLHSI